MPVERQEGESLKDFVARGGSVPAGDPNPSDLWPSEGDLNGAEAKVFAYLALSEGFIVPLSDIEADVWEGKPTGRWGPVADVLQALDAKRPGMLEAHPPYGWRYVG